MKKEACSVCGYSLVLVKSSEERYFCDNCGSYEMPASETDIDDNWSGANKWGNNG